MLQLLLGPNSSETGFLMEGNIFSPLDWVEFSMPLYTYIFNFVFELTLSSKLVPDDLTDVTNLFCFSLSGSAPKALFWSGGPTRRTRRPTETSPFSSPEWPSSSNSVVGKIALQYFRSPWKKIFTLFKIFKISYFAQGLKSVNYHIKLLIFSRN